jgi:hypothetical protein
VGLDPDAFWDKTPFEINFILEARWSGEVRRQNQLAWLAWHIAALSRAKRLPKLQTMLVKKPSTRIKQTWQQQLAIMNSLAAAEQRRIALQKAKDLNGR